MQSLVCPESNGGVVEVSRTILPKPLALDVERTIFPALNSVKATMCVSLWFNNNRMTRNRAGTFGVWSPLILPTLILFLDVAFLTPKSVLRGKQTVLEYVTTHPEASKVPMDSPIVQELQDELAASQDKWHVVYVRSP